jgi:glycosyltransferase involved in cell wall biosynthesis
MVAVFPFHSGSGIKNKVLEALAMEVPVVATPMAAESIAPKVRGCMLLESDPVAFSRKLIALLQDDSLRKTLGARGRALVEKHYSWGHCADQYAALYARAVEKGHQVLGSDGVHSSVMI